MQLKAPVGLTLVLAAAAVLVTGAGAFWNTRALAQATGWVSHTLEVQSTLDQVLALLTDAESAQRGHLLTGRDSELAPYRRAAEQIGPRLDRLQALTSDNPAQQLRGARLRQQVAERLAAGRDIVNAVQAGDAAAGTALLVAGRGKQAMDAVRAELAAMNDEEARLLRVRVGLAQDARRRGQVSAAVTTALILALLGTAYLAMRSASRKVQASEQSLRRSLESAEHVIAEREQAQEALRRNQALLHAIVEGSTAPVYGKDLRGHYFLANAAWRSLAQLAPEQVAGADDEQVFGPETAQRLRSADARVLATGEPLIVEEQALIDGRACTYLSSKFPLRNADGSIYAVCGVSTDITALKQSQQEVQRLNLDLERRVAQRTRQLSEANAELEAFSYTVSHDLRAPLRGLQGFAQALQEDYGDRLDKEGRDYLNRIVAAARRMEVLIRDLLDYGHLSREALPLRQVPLSAVIGEALDQLSRDLAARQARVEVQEPLPSVRAHAPALVQMIANLIGNAVKFVKDGSAPQVSVWAEVRGPRVRVWVQDNGIGIRPEHQERIFRVFERLHGQESYPGTGVGLAIVRKGCERMGGSCGVESQPGVGSRFWLELPGAADPVAPAETTAAATAATTPATTATTTAATSAK